MFDEIAYCYLNTVFVDSQGRILAYELSMSDKAFTDTFSYLASEDEIKSLYRTLNARFNFAFKDGYLKCNQVKRSLVNNLIMENLGKKIVGSKEKYYTLYSLLEEGISDNFMLLADRYAEAGNTINGFGATEFLNVKFSSSTMSVYFNILTDDGLENKHIICMEDYKLSAKPFFFAVPTTKRFSKDGSGGIENLGNLVINNVEYVLYRASEILIYDLDAYVSAGLINRASIDVAKTQNALNILADYRSCMCKALYEERDAGSVPWSGGTGSYESCFGVFYRADMEILSKKRRQKVLDIVLNGIVPECKNSGLEGAAARVKELAFSYEEKVASIALLNVAMRVSSLKDAIFLADKAILCHKAKNVSANLFLYKARSRAYLKKEGYATLLNPIITGSDEAISTIATEVFYYDNLI